MADVPRSNARGARGAGKRSEGTQARGNATRAAIPPPIVITRKDPASGESGRLAGLRAFQTILNSGRYAQTTTAQNSSQYGHTKGRGLTGGGITEGG